MASLQRSGAFKVSNTNTINCGSLSILRNGTLAGVRLDPLNVTDALLNFNPEFLEKDGRILVAGLNHQNLNILLSY